MEGPGLRHCIYPENKEFKAQTFRSSDPKLLLSQREVWYQISIILHHLYSASFHGAGEKLFCTKGSALQSAMEREHIGSSAIIRNDPPGWMVIMCINCGMHFYIYLIQMQGLYKTVYVLVKNK